MKYLIFLVNFSKYFKNYNDLKMHPKFQLNQRLDAIFVATKVKIPKQRRKTFTLIYIDTNITAYMRRAFNISKYRKFRKLSENYTWHHESQIGFNTYAS